MHGLESKHICLHHQSVMAAFIAEWMSKCLVYKKLWIEISMAKFRMGEKPTNDILFWTPVRYLLLRTITHIRTTIIVTTTRIATPRPFQQVSWHTVEHRSASLIVKCLLVTYLALHHKIIHLLSPLAFTVDDLDGNFGAVPGAPVDLPKSSFTQLSAL